MPCLMVLNAIVNNLKAHSSKKNPAAPCKKLPQFIFFLPFYFFTFLPLKFIPAVLSSSL